MFNRTLGLVIEKAMVAISYFDWVWQPVFLKQMSEVFEFGHCGTTEKSERILFFRKALLSQIQNRYYRIKEHDSYITFLSGIQSALVRLAEFRWQINVLLPMWNLNKSKRDQSLASHGG